MANSKYSYENIEPLVENYVYLCDSMKKDDTYVIRSGWVLNFQPKKPKWKKRSGKYKVCIIVRYLQGKQMRQDAILKISGVPVGNPQFLMVPTYSLGPPLSPEEGLS